MIMSRAHAGGGSLHPTLLVTLCNILLNRSTNQLSFETIRLEFMRIKIELILNENNISFSIINIYDWRAPALLWHALLGSTLLESARDCC